MGRFGISAQQGQGFPPEVLTAPQQPGTVRGTQERLGKDF